MFSVAPFAVGAALIWGGHRGVKRKVETIRREARGLEKACQTYSIVVACRAFRDQYVDKHAPRPLGTESASEASS